MHKLRLLSYSGREDIFEGLRRTRSKNNGIKIKNKIERWSYKKKRKEKDLGERRVVELALNLPFQKYKF